MEYLDNIVYWHWMVIGLLLIGVEMLDGSGHAIWLGVAAFFVGIVHWAIPSMPWIAQILLFAASSILSILAWKMYKKAKPVENKFPTLNKRGTNYIDRVVTPSEAIVDGEGKVNVSDTIWKVRGPDMDAGTKVKIKSVEGTSLVVEPLAS